MVVTEPSLPCVTEVIVSGPSTSLSLSKTDTSTGVSSGVVAESSFTTGRSFTGVTVMFTVAVAFALLESVAV